MNEEDDSEERINIMALGDVNVGKTSFIIRYTENTYEDFYLATVGIDFKTKEITIKDKQFKLLFYDTSGEERYKSIALNIIKNSNGIILMYDITKKSSFNAIPGWVKSIQETKGNNFPMILCGNKIDIEDNREVTQQEGEELANEYGIEFFEISNKEGTNVNEVGLSIVNKILEKRKKDKLDHFSTHSSVLSSSTISKSLQKKHSKKCC